MHTPAKNHFWATRPVDLLDERGFALQVHAPEELRRLVDGLENLLRDLGYPPQDLFAVTLTLHEAATNAFRHGNRSDPSKPIDIRGRVTTTQALFEVADQGTGFDPSQVPDPLSEEALDRPGGRGLFLMRTYATWVTFNGEGNRVTFCRQRSQP